VKVFSGVCAFAMLAGSGLATAADAIGHVDFYYVPDTKMRVPINPGNGHLDSDGGKGFGIQGRFFFRPQVFIDGQYQASSYDGIGGDGVAFDIDWLRAGIGHSTPMNLYVLGQLVRIEGQSAETGFGLQVGYHTDLGNPWELRVQVGYLDVGDVGDGFELLIGGAFELTKPVRFFADYRVTTLENVDKLQFFDVLAGIRLRF